MVRMPAIGLRPALLALLLGLALVPNAGGSAPPDTTAAAQPCRVCLLWDEYDEALRYATVEAGVIEHGVVYYLSSTDFSVVESIQRFAYERRRLEEDPAALAHAHHRGMGDSGTVRLEVTTGVHGVFALLQSDDPAVVRFLREEAATAVRFHLAPRF